MNFSSVGHLGKKLHRSLKAESKQMANFQKSKKCSDAHQNLWRPSWLPEDLPPLITGR